MTLIRYTRPRTDLFGSRFSDIMDEFFNEALTKSRESFIPAMDVSETETHVEFDVYLPGLSKDQIRIETEKGYLTVSGERHLEPANKNRTYHKIENAYGAFKRSIQLPDHLDLDSIRAEHKDGILRIRIEKSEQNVRKEVKIH